MSPAIHALLIQVKTWMPGIKPGTTRNAEDLMEPVLATKYVFTITALVGRVTSAGDTGAAGSGRSGSDIRIMIAAATDCV